MDWVNYKQLCNYKIRLSRFYLILELISWSFCLKENYSKYSFFTCKY